MTMITPSYLGETIEYSSLHACRSTLEDPTGEIKGLKQNDLWFFDAHSDEHNVWALSLHTINKQNECYLELIPNGRYQENIHLYEHGEILYGPSADRNFLRIASVIQGFSRLLQG